MDEPFSLAAQAAEVLSNVLGVARFSCAVVLGSGWAPAADQLGRSVAEVPFAEVPGFPVASVVGHAGVFRAVETADGRSVLAMLGRVHLYEGHPVATVVHGIRTMVACGADVVALTNSCGGLRPGMFPGQPVVLRDQINFTGVSPLAGPTPPSPHASRFVDLTDLYSPRLRAKAVAIDPTLEEGVYVGFPGPMYETPAEVEMVRRWGGDLVGMSTVLEAITARHLGAEVFGVSLVTNLAAGITGEKLDHREVLDVASATAMRMGRLLADVLRPDVTGG